MKRLIFWRHAEAGIGIGLSDLERTLSDEGQNQAKATAEWLRPFKSLPIYCSPSVRGQQTAAHLGKPVTIKELNPDEDLNTVFQALSKIKDSAIIVGHMPWIGRVVSELLGTPGGYLPFGYSEAVCLQSEDGVTWKMIARFNGETGQRTL